MPPSSKKVEIDGSLDSPFLITLLVSKAKIDESLMSDISFSTVKLLLKLVRIASKSSFSKLEFLELAGGGSPACLLRVWKSRTAEEDMINY